MAGHRMPPATLTTGGGPSIRGFGVTTILRSGDAGAASKPLASAHVAKSGAEKELGTTGRMATMTRVPVLAIPRFLLMAMLLSSFVWSGGAAAPDAGIYSARPGLAQVVLAGRAVALQIDPAGDAVG